MLAHAAMLCPALIFTTPQLAPARSPSRAASIRALAPVQGSLPEMHRARWQHEADEAEEQQMTTTVDVPASSKQRPSRLGGVLSIGGALAGVSLMSAIGTRTSDALAPLSLTFLHNSWCFGGAHDITAYTDTITQWAAESNALFASPSSILAYGAFCLAILVDLGAIASVIAVIYSFAEDRPPRTDRPASEVLASHDKTWWSHRINGLTSEVCVLTAATEAICGTPSFDSSTEYACVEQWVDGKLRWVCS
mmetsp:Transcript_9666/g.23424  ORF Transcript_9666/g.23424 Transcript_9666/m.23424 type:complete len:250 (-) Transcript_9666:348-1097(-)